MKSFRQYVNETPEQTNEGFGKTVVGAFAVGGAIGFGGAMHNNAQRATDAPQAQVEPAETTKAAHKAAPKTNNQADNTQPKYHHDAIKAMVIQDEGMRLKPYNDTRGILTVGIGHNLEASGSKATFGRAFGEQGAKLHRHASGGGSLTQEQVTSLFDADYEHHLQRTIKLIPNLHTHPPQVQAALVSGTYRGHIGDSPTFRKHFNAGNYTAASNEFLNRGEYTDSSTGRGVITRLNRDHKIYSDYAATMEQQ